ncbi:hypothetical protein HYE29_00850 [Mycoplasmopsis bovis]|nr:hypothetical protein [Mycoplasmopsis bovis]QQH22719.1 hypothetical protein HYE29_00850 [Mycoplasmopsis bovis]
MQKQLIKHYEQSFELEEASFEVKKSLLFKYCFILRINNFLFKYNYIK